MVPELEHIVITMLINENIRIGNGNGTILVAGLDDIHLYGTGDIEKALMGKRNNEFTLLMAHIPELYREASAMGVNYYLCGHTHGGQICLPNGNPLFTNTNCPKEYVSGSREFGEMRGYTSRGTGISGLPARFFCPPEVTLHTLLSTSSLNDI
jgi:predicted MPP superfamily phosphohydrolase